MGIYERIQQKTIEKGISIKFLEKKVGLGNGVIKKWSTSFPQCNKLLLVANYLQVSLDWLVTGNNVNTINNAEKELLTYFSELPKDIQNDYIQEIKGAAKTYKNISGKSSESQTG